MSEFAAPQVPESLADAADALESVLAGSLSYWDERFHSIGRLIAEWSELASSSSQFGGMIEEYIHQLGSRDILHDIMLAAEGPLRVWLVREIDKLDEVFRSATDLDREDLMWGGNVDRPCHWWHRRVPRDENLRAEIALLAPEMRRTREPRAPA
jgi:hypothetical protein